MGNIEQLVEQSINAGDPVVYLLVLAAGIATSFTPCVFPVIPLIVAYIGAQKLGSRMQAFFISLAYVFGMAITFSVLGIIAALTGRIFGSIQSNPLTHIFVGAVILIMTLWFWDVIRFPIPSFHIPGIKNKGVLPAVVLGVVSGLITAPCTAAILAIILAYVGTRQNVLLGGTLLFTYAMGLGALIIIAGSFTGFVNNLMKAGPHIGKIRIVFGIGLLTVALYFFYKAWLLW